MFVDVRPRKPSECLCQSCVAYASTPGGGEGQRAEAGGRPATKETAPMKIAVVYVLASLGEIAGCFSFWAWLRLGKSPLWLMPGMASLAVFAYLLTRIDSNTAGAHTPRTEACTSCRRFAGSGRWKGRDPIAGTHWAQVWRSWEQAVSCLVSEVKSQERPFRRRRWQGSQWASSEA
jgi:Uncharacterised BCR, YnfA/UPF0060 family